MTRNWMEGMVQWPPIRPDFPIDAHHFMLVTVDMQNYLWDPACGLAKVIREDMPEIADYYFPRLKDIVIPNHIKLIDFLRKNSIPLIYITVGPEREDGKDFLGLRQKASEISQSKTNLPTIPVKGTYAHNIIEAIAPLQNELVLNKLTRSAFTSTGLDQIMRNMGINTVAFTGAATNVCVETTARDAADRGYRCILVEDACATLDRATQHATMQTWHRVFGKVMSTNELIGELNTKR
ncbi:MAG: isochorismatase family cysteine hydrolase [Pseudomonadota bacterium]